MKVDKYIKSRLRHHYDYITSLGYEIVGIFAQGSMNYNLFILDDDYKSDVDTKCIVIPTLGNLIKGERMVSKKYDFEGEQIDVKDIRIMMEMWKKQNHSYLEILFTKYSIINPKYKDMMNEILSMRNDIANMNPPQFARSISGMSRDKVALLGYPYPSIIKKIEKYGYDPKQLASIIRLTHLIENFFIRKLPFDESITYKNEVLRQYMIDVKKGKISLDEAQRLSKLYDDATLSIKNMVIEQYGKDCFNDETFNHIKNIIYKMITRSIILRLYKNIELNKLYKNFTYFNEEEQKNEKEVIRKLSVKNQENIYDYYKGE